MSTWNRKLKPAVISQAFTGAPGETFPVILSPTKLATLLGLSPKTIYQWIAQGRLDGAFRKRVKHVLIWRDRALDLIFNDVSWSTHE